MTVSSDLNRKEFVGNGVTTSFGTSPMVFFDSGDLLVYIVVTATGAETLLTEGTHYTVSGGSGSTGTVSTAGGSSPFGAPSALQTLVIVRELDITQETDFVNNDVTDAEVAEDTIDRLTMICQQLDARIGRSFVLADSDVTGASTLIPTPEAGTVIGWDDDGMALQNYVLTDLDIALTTPYSLTLLDDANAAAARLTLGISAIAAKGDLLQGTAANTIGTLTVGANGKVLTADSTATTGAAWSDVPLPRSYLAGCTLSNNSGDATNDIDFAVGVCRDSTNTVNIQCAAMTKRLDANWSAGTGNGMRNSAAAITDTTYFIYAARKADGTQDYYAHTSATVSTVLTALQAETGGADYLYLRRIGAILRESGAIVAFIQEGDVFMRSAQIQSTANTADHTTAATATLHTPVGVKLQAIIQGAVNDNGSGGHGTLATSLDQANTAPGAITTTPGLTWAGDNTAAVILGAVLRVRTNTSAQIRYRASHASIDTWIYTLGWVDTRGRDD